MNPSRSKSIFLTTLFFAATLALGSTASATLVVEDFGYDVGPLTGRGGVTQGWGGTWGVGASTSRLFVDNTRNLEYSGGGYNITQSGTGLAYGNFNDFRGINRAIDINQTGTIWFSVLINNTGADDRTGLQFNNHPETGFVGNDYSQGLFHVELFGSDLQVRYNGNTYANTATLQLNTTHLLIGRLTIGAGNDRLELWADPTNVLNLGPALFDQSDANIGDNLFMAGIFSYGSIDAGTTGHGRLDAIRISDGGGNPTQALQDVVGVPEPAATLLLLTGGLLIGTVRRASRRNRK